MGSFKERNFETKTSSYICREFYNGSGKVEKEQWLKVNKDGEIVLKDAVYISGEIVRQVKNKISQTNLNISEFVNEVRRLNYSGLDGHILFLCSDGGFGLSSKVIDIDPNFDLIE
jgi:hypothetical protein